jgi:hypothetical protein
MSANLKLVRSIYAAWEQGDFSQADWADPEIEYIHADGPDPGRWQGPAAMVFQSWHEALKAVGLEQ